MTDDNSNELPAPAVGATEAADVTAGQPTTFGGHGLRLRTSKEVPFYSPQRDFVYNYPQLIACVIRAFNNDYWPELFELSKQASGLDDDSVMQVLTQVKDSYCEFIKRCCDDPFEKVEQTLHRVGWYSHPAWAQRAWLAMIGTVMTGQLWAGLREETKLDEPPIGLDDFLKAADKSRLAIENVRGDEESLREFRQSVRVMRERGHTFEQITEAVADVRFGRV